MLSAHLDNFKIFSILIAKWRGFLDTLKFNESSIVIIRKSLEIYFITKRENVFFINLVRYFIEIYKLIKI